MRKSACLILAVVMTVLLTSCGALNKNKQVELTEKDIKYIDTVFEYMSGWDVSQYDSGKNWSINKISFFDFDGTDKLTFYVNYPITDIYGQGYYVYEDSMKAMSFDVYDHEGKTRNSGCVVQNTTNGTDWDSTATDEEKYETIKKAYTKFLQSNVDGYEMKSDQEIVSESDTTSHPNESIEYNGHHYKLFTQGMNWNEAKEYCQSFGGHLLTISSTEENKFIVDTFLINNDAGILLGFSDNEKEGKWIWVNDEEVIYTNWAENEPNNENNEDYALVYHDGTWNDGHLEKENWPFVCEWDY